MVFEYDSVVVGSSLSALLFAYINDCVVLFAETQKPFRFDYLNVDANPLKIPTCNKSLTTFEGKLQKGIQKQILWDRLFFLLSVNGKIPLSNMCSKLRYDGRSIVCSNDYSKILEVVFNRCHYFGDKDSEGFVLKNTLDEDSYLCYDYIAFNSGGKHEIDYIHTGDDFVSEIWFYSSDRIDGNTPVRDACAVSKLSKQQLLDFDYSETMARFKVLKTMKDKGMKGKPNGYTEKGTLRHYDFRTTSIRRETSGIRNRFRAASPDIKIEVENEKGLLGLLQNARVPSDRLLDILNVNSP